MFNLVVEAHLQVLRSTSYPATSGLPGTRPVFLGLSSGGTPGGTRSWSRHNRRANLKLQPPILGPEGGHSGTQPMVVWILCGMVIRLRHRITDPV